jgi:hypothetical protein
LIDLKDVFEAKRLKMENEEVDAIRNQKAIPAFSFELSD